MDCVPPDPWLIPSPEDAVRQYEEAGSGITHFSAFGEDHLVNEGTKVHNPR